MADNHPHLISQSSGFSPACPMRRAGVASATRMGSLHTLIVIEDSVPYHGHAKSGRAIGLHDPVTPVGRFGNLRLLAGSLNPIDMNGRCYGSESCLWPTGTTPLTCNVSNYRVVVRLLPVHIYTLVILSGRQLFLISKLLKTSTIRVPSTPTLYILNKFSFDSFGGWKAIQLLNGTLNAAAVAYHWCHSKKLFTRSRGQT
jgi:hypothetical protein